MLYETASKN